MVFSASIEGVADSHSQRLQSAQNEDLLEQLKHDDPHAKRALFQRFGREINRVVGNVLGVDREHDDIVQEVFVKILRNVHQLRDPNTLRAWVVSVAVNTVRTHIRRRSFRRAFGVQSEQPLDIPWNDDHDKRQLMYAVQRVFQKIPTEEQLLLILRLVEGHSIDELSSILSVSQATVKRRLTHARKRFASLALDDAVLRGELDEITEMDP